MRVSIITICYNNEKDIRDTLESVINQSYSNIEYIVVDGASKDASLSIINEYKDNIHLLISEPDNGIYDAINKGIKAATGDIVGLIHAGDKLHDIDTIEKIANFHIENKIDISYGHSKIIDANGKIRRINRSPNYSRSLIRRGWMPSHQSIYCKRELFNKYGYYNTEIGWAADYEWFIRMFYVQRLIIKRIDLYVLKFSLGGTSTNSYKSRFTKNHKQMIHKCWSVNNTNPPSGIVYWQLFRKIKQLLLAYIER